MITNKLWVEAYRPSTVDEYVFQDETLKEQVESWISDKTIPNLLISGGAGTGKTSLAKILINELNVNECDVLIANGSSEGRKIDWFKDKLLGFCQTMPFGDFKIVLIDEGDYLNAQSVQPALRNLMEDYCHSVRFIMTCNYPNRIIPPLHSRCQHIKIEKPDLTEFTARVATILVDQNVEFTLEVLDTYVKGTYPDLRKCINNVQMNSIGGILRSAIPDDSNSTTDHLVKMTELFKAGKISEARRVVCSNISSEEIEDVYRWMYSNLDLISLDPDKQDSAILVIKQGMVDHALVIDPEINLAAVMIKLARL